MAEVRRFPRALYRREAIDTAVARFAGLGTFEVSEEAGDFLVSIVPAHARVADRLGDELANHVLFETVNLRRAE